MKTNQMRAFHELMLTGSVSEAARNLHRSQPAVSALIANLERELDMPLFERRGGRPHPVPEAHYLHERAHALYRGASGPIRFLPFRPRIGYGTAILTPAHRTPSLLIRAFTERLGEELRGECPVEGGTRSPVEDPVDSLVRGSAPAPS